MLKLPSFARIHTLLPNQVSNNVHPSTGYATSTPSLADVAYDKSAGWAKGWMGGKRGMTHGAEDRARGIDVRGGRNSMNYYRLAAHFASRSCDGLVKRFGLSIPPTLFPASLLFLLHQHDADAASYIPPCYFSFLFFFPLHAITPSRRGSKASQRGSRSPGIFETKDESRGCTVVGVSQGGRRRRRR